jgi:excisionase family DNA binding protein
MLPRGQQAERHRVTTDAANTVAVPLNLAPLAALLVELGAREITQRGGARSAMQGLPQLEAILRDAAAAAGARATPARTLELRPKPEELTTVQAAAVMGISASRVREHAKTGRIIARKVGRDWLIDAGSARSYRRNA